MNGIFTGKTVPLISCPVKPYFQENNEGFKTTFPYGKDDMDIYYDGVLIGAMYRRDCTIYLGIPPNEEKVVLRLKK